LRDGQIDGFLRLVVIRVECGIEPALHPGHGAGARRPGYTATQPDRNGSNATTAKMTQDFQTVFTMILGLMDPFGASGSRRRTGVPAEISPD
jgi:hypothetical protein